MADANGQELQEKELRKTLLKRLGFAGIMVLVLLAVLAFFDHLSARREEVQHKVFKERVPVAPRKEVSQPVKPALSSVEAPGPAVGEMPALSQTQATPALSATAVVEEGQNGDGTKGANRPDSAESKPVSAPVKKPLAVTAKPVEKPKPVPEGTAAPVVEQVAAPVRSKPEQKPQQAEKPVQAAVTPAASLPRLFSGFLVQAGVFTNARKAEELHARLALNGIHSTLEARVRIGPFKTRAEAEAAKKKLKELGIDGLLIPPLGRR